MAKRSPVKIIITLLLVVGAFALIAFVLTNNKKKNAAKTAVVSQSNGDISVRTSTATKQALELGFTANGNFVPGQQMDFSAENSGRVIKVYVDEGSKVSRGQTLAVIKTDQLNVDVESAQANFANATKDLSRYENAYKTGGVTQQQLDQAKLAVENAKARLSQAQIKVGDANIRSSINGIVNKRYIEPGAVVAPGTKLFELVDVSKLKLAITVNEQQVASLKVGDKVNIRASVFPDKNFEGRITFIAPKSDASLNFPVEIELASNPGTQLRAGMYGTAVFEFPTQTPVITIPRTAFGGSVSSNQVFVVENGNTAKTRKVIAGRIIGDQVEILEGLNEGETVITSGQINLTEGSKVAPIK
jgi:RND family efflux transporter MFP subunit